MATVSSLIIDLALPPSERWKLNEKQRDEGRALFRLYNQELGFDRAEVAELAKLAGSVLSPAQLGELDGVSRALGLPLGDVLVGNLHYDLFKLKIGCTAFAVDHPAGPLHGRNLDWWTRDRMLQDLTMVTQFVNGPAGKFLTVGWPGFVGAFSGMAEGRFAITLNAVLSNEPSQVATPIVFLIREVLETALDFEEAVRRLAETPIATDCLLLVTGIRKGEAVVVERTPSSQAVRRAVPLAVTNEYLALKVDTAGQPVNDLVQTSCGRLGRIRELIGQAPESLAGCLDCLSDSRVKMEITVQQMAFQAATGRYQVKIP